MFMTLVFCAYMLHMIEKYEHFGNLQPIKSNRKASDQIIGPAYVVSFKIDQRRK